jgi:signal transduction histidine kinase
VINNLLENAISYSGEGSEVKVSMVDKPTEVSIKIFDSGKGIRETDLPYVLDPFFRADAARTPGDCHSGLGLSIACRLIEAHDGKLTLTSEEGKGTTAEIVVPK